MAKKIKALITMNKANHQINLTVPKKKISKKMLIGLENSKRVEINLNKLYPK